MGRVFDRGRLSRRRWLGLLAASAMLGATRARAARAQAVAAGVPARVVIPQIGVDARVVTLDLLPDLTMPAPDRGDRVAWYTFSAPAGSTGNTVLAGHRDYNRQRGVFWSLALLAPGDELWLQDAERRWFLYTVAWSESLVEEGAPVGGLVGATPLPAVTLITCDGVFDPGIGRYVERRIVRAELAATA